MCLKVKSKNWKIRRISSWYRMRLQNLFAVTFFDFGGMETQGQPLSNTSWESISGLNPQV